MASVKPSFGFHYNSPSRRRPWRGELCSDVKVKVGSCCSLLPCCLTALLFLLSSVLDLLPRGLPGELQLFSLYGGEKLSFPSPFSPTRTSNWEEQKTSAGHSQVGHEQGSALPCHPKNIGTWCLPLRDYKFPEDRDLLFRSPGCAPHPAQCSARVGASEARQSPCLFASSLAPSRKPDKPSSGARKL